MNETSNRVNKLENKLKQKVKRIHELENTIIDHFEMSSKKDQSSFNQNNFNQKSNSNSMMPTQIEKYENNIRNFKTLLNEARK